MGSVDHGVAGNWHLATNGPIEGEVKMMNPVVVCIEDGRTTLLQIVEGGFDEASALAEAKSAAIKWSSFYPDAVVLPALAEVSKCKRWDGKFYRL